MASQWMPALHQYTKAPASKRNGLTASEMVTRAQTKPTTRLQIAFVSQTEGLRVLTVNNDQELPMGTVEDNTRLTAGLESMAETLQVPEEWVTCYENHTQPTPKENDASTKYPKAVSRDDRPP